MPIIILKGTEARASFLPVMRTVRHHRHAANVYASGPLDRMDKLRLDDAALQAALDDPETRIFPVWRGLNLVRYGATLEWGWLAGGSLDFRSITTDLVFLGASDDGAAHFAIDLSHQEDHPDLIPDSQFEDLRKVGPMLSADHGSVLAYARGLMNWHARHRFCGVCGTETTARKAGHERRCLNPDCGATHFPRTDPAVIMLIHDGADRIVLASQPSWPPGRCSVLAGFVETGESLEDAVAREVMEEVGLEVTDIRYNSSQPWPFPSSIMLGFSARAIGTDLVVDTDELQDARWVSRAEIADCPEDETFALPRRDSIAYRLIHDWMSGD